MKRCWKVILPGHAPFTLILMEDCDPLQVVRSIWPNAEVE